MLSNILYFTTSLGVLLYIGLLRGSTPADGVPANIYIELHVWEYHLHDQLCYFEGSAVSFCQYDGGGQNSFYREFFGVHVTDAVNVVPSSFKLAGDRIHFTVIYLGSMLLTLYLTFTAGGAKGYVLVLGASALQLLVLLWYLVAFLPGGATGMKVWTQALWTLLKPLMIGCAKCQAMCIGRCVSWYASRFTFAES
ncbi:hypothetical protein HJC23_000376 [Cyclotella cryptica]|uniref:Uncharacterized protein n=1 Tax=Cyclotella cryptica TaxID=29204 RepID=A0ABD3P7M4_9STRA